MPETQIHYGEIYPGAISDIHVNNSADIRGTKIREATTLERGAVIFALDGSTNDFEAVQGSDSRLHSQNSDTGTTSNTFIVNSDHSADDNSTVVLYSSVAGAGGGIRYNDTSSELEFCFDYNGAKTWYPFSTINLASDIDVTGDWNYNGGTLGLPLAPSVSPQEGDIYWDDTTNTFHIYDDNSASWLEPGGGLLYSREMYGSNADNAPDNTQYSLLSGNWDATGSNLFVFVNGQRKMLLGGTDYTVIDTNTIEFVNERADTDRIGLYVFSNATQGDGHTQDADTGTSQTTFRVGLLNDELAATPLNLLFGTGGSDPAVGIRNNAGIIQYRHSGGSWTPLSTFDASDDQTITGDWSFEGKFKLPFWTVAGRPTAELGLLGYNTDTNQLEFNSDGTADGWKIFG